MHARPTETRAQPSLFDNLRWGFLWGCRGGALLVILESIARIFGGPEILGSLGMTYLYAIGIDFCAGVPAGIVLGLLRPFLSSAKSAAAVGILVALPAAAVLMLGLNGLRLWTLKDAFASLIYALIMGPLVGVPLWFKAQDIKKHNP